MFFLKKVLGCKRVDVRIKLYKIEALPTHFFPLTPSISVMDLLSFHMIEPDEIAHSS